MAMDLITESEIFSKATRLGLEHERLAVEQAVAPFNAEIDRLHQLCLDVMRERDEAVAVTVERCAGDAETHDDHACTRPLRECIAWALRRLSPNPDYIKRLELEARLDETERWHLWGGCVSGKSDKLYPEICNACAHIVKLRSQLAVLKRPGGE